MSQGWQVPVEQRRAPTHRPWSTVLLVLHGIAVALTGAVTAGAVVLLVIGIVTSSSVPEDQFHEPYAVAFGALGLVVAGPALALAVLLLVLTVRGRRRADRGSPGLLLGAAITATAVGGLLLVATFVTPDPLVVVTALLLAGPYLAVAVRLVVALRR